MAEAHTLATELLADFPPTGFLSKESAVAIWSKRWEWRNCDAKQALTELFKAQLIYRGCGGDYALTALGKRTLGGTKNALHGQ